MQPIGRDYEASLLEGLRKPEPMAHAQGVLSSLADDGYGAEAVVAWLEALRERARNDGREADEDLLAASMDIAAGCCPPHLRVWPEPITD